MNKLSILQLENIHKLKDLLELYETSFLDDMINDQCADREDDEMLEYNLSLKNRVMECLQDAHEIKNFKAHQKLGPPHENFKDVQKGDILKTSHKTPPFVSKHYCKPTKPTQPTLPGFEDLPEDKT